MKVVYLFPFLILVLIISGCTQNIAYTEPALGGLAFETISQDDHSGYTESKNFVVTKENDFKTLWDNIYSKQPLPKVDFNREMIIFVSSVRNTAGYSIEISKIVNTEKDVEVTVVERGSGGGSMVAQVITYPYHIVKTEKVNKPLVFIRATGPRDKCSSDRDCWCINFDGATFYPDEFLSSKCNAETGFCEECIYL